jgi:hypothetical protein
MKEARAADGFRNYVPMTAEQLAEAMKQKY